MKINNISELKKQQKKYKYIILKKSEKSIHMILFF